MKKKLLRPTAKEDAAITKAALLDPDNPPITDGARHAIQHRVVRGRGRPVGSGTKEQITLRIDKETLDFYKSKGEGWQTLINQVLGEVKREAKSISAVEKKLGKTSLIGKRLKAAT